MLCLIIFRSYCKSGGEVPAGVQKGHVPAWKQAERVTCSFFHLSVLVRPPAGGTRPTYTGEGNLLSLSLLIHVFASSPLTKYLGIPWSSLVDTKLSTSQISWINEKNSSRPENEFKADISSWLTHIILGPERPAEGILLNLVFKSAKCLNVLLRYIEPRSDGEPSALQWMSNCFTIIIS